MSQTANERHAEDVDAVLRRLDAELDALRSWSISAKKALDELDGLSVCPLCTAHAGSGGIHFPGCPIPDLIVDFPEAIE